MFLPKVKKSVDVGITKNIKKVVAAVLMSAALAIPSVEAKVIDGVSSDYVNVASQTTKSSVLLLQQFNADSLGSAYHYSHSSHSSHYSHSSHRSHYSHYSGY